MRVTLLRDLKEARRLPKKACQPPKLRQEKTSFGGLPKLRCAAEASARPPGIKIPGYPRSPLAGALSVTRMGVPDGTGVGRPGFQSRARAATFPHRHGIGRRGGSGMRRLPPGVDLQLAQLADLVAHGGSLLELQAL